jgi:hypothetical protein
LKGVFPAAARHDGATAGRDIVLDLIKAASARHEASPEVLVLATDMMGLGSEQEGKAHTVEAAAAKSTVAASATIDARPAL